MLLSEPFSFSPSSSYPPYCMWRKVAVAVRGRRGGGLEVSATQPNHLLLQQVQRPVSRRSLWAASSGASSPLSVHFN